MYQKQAIFDRYPETERITEHSTDQQKSKVIPFVLNDKKSPKYKEKIINSEVKYECWFIENPVSKELTKKITLKLGPQAQQKFIIVVRSPNLKVS